MVVWLTFYYSASTIELFGKYQTHHLVREGKPREAQLVVGSLIDIWRETVGATYHKHQAARCLLSLFEPLGQFYASQLCSMFVQEHQRI